MGNSKIDNIVNLTAAERYDYFIRKHGFMSEKGVATFVPFTIDDLYSIFDF